MRTVASRTFRSSPHRTAPDTWRAIVALLTKGQSCAARNELLAITGITSSIIADRVLEEAAIVVTCDGPRTRIYCIYDEDAIVGSDANEDTLGFDPLHGDWRVSLPCDVDDLEWIQRALKEHSTRITARATGDAATGEKNAANAQQPLALDTERFLAK